MSAQEFQYLKDNIKKDWELFYRLKDKLNCTQKVEFVQVLIEREMALGL